MTANARLRVAVPIALSLLGPVTEADAQGVAPPPGVESAEFQSATASFVAGRYAECRVEFGQVLRSAKRPRLASRAAYGAACCAAQAGRIDLAYEDLALATANGFDDVERALGDARLEPLRADPRWLPFLRQVEEVRRLATRKLDGRLLLAFQELEAERSGTRTPSVEQTARRTALALELVDGGKLREPEDLFLAASILVESELVENVGRARNLAMRTLELDPDRVAARPVYATALDRELLLQGKPQKFGTQTVLRDGAWTLYEVDPAVTDTDRAAWNLPPLAQLRARLAELATGPVAPAPPSP